MAKYIDNGELAAILERADRLNELCLARIDKIFNAEEGSPEAIELNSLADAVEAYESLRWPIDGPSTT